MQCLAKGKLKVANQQQAYSNAEACICYLSKVESKACMCIGRPDALLVSSTQITCCGVDCKLECLAAIALVASEAAPQYHFPSFHLLHHCLTCLALHSVFACLCAGLMS